MAGWLLLLGVMYVPWHEGGVAPLATPVLSSIVFIAALFWLWGHSLGRTRPRLSFLCATCIALLLLQGWWMVANARQAYDPLTHEFFRMSNFWHAAPGSVDGWTSETAALNATSMLLAVCIVGDLSRYAKWRKRFVYAMAVDGALVATYGLFRNATGDTIPTGSGLALHQGTLFATFDYHGNAGSFLILCLPAAFALLLNKWQRGHRPWKVALAGLPLPLIVAGSIVNVSRAAQAVTVLMTMGLMGWAFWRLQRPERKEGSDPESMPERRWGWAAVLPLVVLVAMITGAAATTHARWASFPTLINAKNPRLIMWRVCCYWLGDAGPLGYGPGTYKLLYPTTPRELLRELYPRWIVHPHTPGGPVSIWSNVHNDYLQLAFEWGWLGVAVWAVLLFGGLALAVRTAGRRHLGFSDTTLAACTAFALAGLLLHATVDFPLQVLALQMYAGVYVGLGWGSTRWAAEQREPVTRAADAVTADSFRYN